MKLFSYDVARDFGFAPNPFYQFCTLGTCKPEIRRHAEVGDWVVGTGSKTRGRDRCIVFVMQITEVMSFECYWSDTRFQQKKPNLRGVPTLQQSLRIASLCLAVRQREQLQV